MKATGTVMTIATLAVAPFALFADRAIPWSPISLGAWSGVVYGDCVGMVAAMALWGWSIRHLGPNETMAHLYREPVSAVLLAAFLLGESLSAQQALGAIIAFIAVWLASRPRPGQESS